MPPIIDTEEWSEEKFLKLIKEYRARPILWNQKNRSFYKKNLKPSAWQDIGRVLNTSGEQCKHKMLIMVSVFRRERARLMHSLRKDSSQAYKSKWFAFNEMLFMMDKDLEKKYQPNEQKPGTCKAVWEVDEEIKSFTTFIANKMRRYTDTTKNAVQQAICDIIFKADQNQYETDIFKEFLESDVE